MQAGKGGGSRKSANQGFAIFPVKIRKYIIKVLFRSINTNISVNEQPEWFHWAHRRWPFYTYCTSRFRSWSFNRYRKRFGYLDQWPWHAEKHRKRHDWNCLWQQKSPHPRVKRHSPHTTSVYFILSISNKK